MNPTPGANNPNALSRQVAQAIKDGGPMTADDLAQIFHRFSRKQIYKALQNAKARSWVWLEKRGSSGKTGIAGVWAPVETAEVFAPPVVKVMRVKPLASVWELGGREPCDIWPLPFEGGRVYVSPEEVEEAA